MSNSAILHRTSTLFHPENRHPLPDSDVLSLHHIHASVPGRSSSAVVHHILAPVAAVWSIVRRFDSPHSYKHFIKSCDLLDDSGELRRVHVVSGLPAATSVERLEILDDERHVIGFRVVGGDHRLANYRSVTTCHAVGGDRTVVVESYVVDTPEGNTEEETCLFVDTIVRCNLRSLAQIAQNMHEKK